MRPSRPYRLGACALGFAILMSGCDARSAIPDSAADSASAPRPTSSAPPVILVSGDSAGPLPITATRADLSRIAVVVRDTSEEGDEGMIESVAIVVVDGDTIRAVLDDSARVHVYYLRSPRFRTRDSLGVGTPLSQLLRFPGTDAVSGEGQVFARVPHHCGLSFRISDAAELGDAPDSIGAEALSRLPMQTHVSEVLVFGCRATRSGVPR